MTARVLGLWLLLAWPTGATAASALLQGMQSPVTRWMFFACGGFFLVGMICGIWKYAGMMNRDTHLAPRYVDIAHRAGLQYAFACLILAHFAEFSPFSTIVTAIAAGAPVFYFSIALATYIKLGITEETDNQFAHRNWLTTWGMYLLIAGEFGGFAVLFAGFVITLFSG